MFDQVIEPNTHSPVFSQSSADWIRSMMLNRNVVQVSIPKRPKINKYRDDIGIDPTVPLATDKISLTVHRFWALAPYTGRPFFYTWLGAVSVPGIIWVTGDVLIEYIPYNIDLDDYHLLSVARRSL